ncbi:MAG TPA: endonuclease/exonuclease/phosphatase family protein [Thermoguttaceae bacterium]|nr:endonuclease/exonuclease/phosphatase family protein [Thermoguttaceae bacterium]
MRILDKTKYRWVSLVIAIAAAVGVWHASLRVGTGPASGEGLSDFPANLPAPGLTFRVGTLNLAGGKGPDGRRDLARAGDVLRGLDLVALQEVHVGGLVADDNQARSLGRQLHLGWLYAPTETRWHCRQFGNAVLSDLPVTHWQRIPLPRCYDRSYRNVVFLVLDDGSRLPVHILAVHATQRDVRDRRVQLRAVIQLFLALQEPAILLGDLNATPDDPAIRDLLARPDVEDPVGRLADSPPPGRVDWIIVRGLRCVTAGVRDEGVSDHPLYWAELEWPGAKQEVE